MAPQRKAVELPDGTEFEFWMTPLTIAERQRAQRSTKSDDAIEFALNLLISKATDQSGEKLFAPGQAAQLRNDLPAAVIDELMLVLLSAKDEEGEGEEEDYSPKQSPSNSRKTRG